MASSLAEDLVCPICLALFQEPHMLGCGHNFCLACLRGSLPAGQQEGGTCPECRSPFQPQEPKRNRALGNLAKKVRRWQGDGEPPGGSPAELGRFCEAHDEPLKLFCTQDQAPICVICRDLPRHRRHRFLPTRDAVQAAQGKLKAYLKHLEKHLKETAEDESDQLKEIEALKSCTDDLLGHISKEFEVLHQILRKKEEEIKLVIEKMKGENMEEMEDSLATLKVEVFSRTETVAKTKAALEETDQVAFLKGLKELMERVKEDLQGEVNYEETEEESEDHEETEEKSDDEAKEKSDKDESGEELIEDSDCEDEDDEDYEPDETERDFDRVIPVEPALEDFGESLDFETWKEMLEGIKPRQVR